MSTFCSRCGQYYDSTYYHNCYPQYQYQQPQQIYATVQQDPMLAQAMNRMAMEMHLIQIELSNVVSVLEKVLNRTHNSQDEEVRGYTEGERRSTDSGGVSEVCISLSPRSAEILALPSAER